MLEARSVEQVLRVLDLFRQNKRLGFDTAAACSRAIRQTAKEYGLCYQTIGDGCRRRLELKDMSVFHHLAEAWLTGNPDPLATVIKSHSLEPTHALISNFLSASSGEEDSPRGERALTTLQLAMSKSDAKMLHVLAQLEEKDVEVLARELLRSTTRDRLRAALG